MKELSELNFPDDVKYTKDHEWAKVEGDQVRIGITDYAQDQLGDVVFVEVPEVGAKFKQGQQCGTLESVKAVAELYIPISGEITAVNADLEESPALVNDDPFGKGWIALVRPDSAAEIDTLMSHTEYLEMVKGTKE